MANHVHLARTTPPRPLRPTSRGLIAAVVTSLFLGVFAAAPADAVTCDAHAKGTWDATISPPANCTVGSGYDTAANYITGIQRILKGLGFYGGSIDGLWGPLSQGATQNYQASEGIAADGIVGPNTWGHLYGEIFFCTTAAPYKYYRAPWSQDPCVGSFRYAYNTSLLWYIKKLNGTWHVAFSTSGPS
jgi:Putative peptidoglycan binding domain